MHLLWRTLASLKPYWKRLVVASSSAAIHAILGGLFVWMAGPLLMTLFAVSDIGIPGMNNGTATEQTTTQSQPEQTVKKNPADFDFLVKTKNNLKEAVHKFVTGPTRRDTLLNLCMLIFAIGVVSNIFGYLQGFFMAYVQESVIRDFRNRLFDKYQELSLSFFHHRRTGHLISRVTNDVVVLNSAVDLGFNSLVADSLTVILLAGFLVLLSWKLTLLAAVVLPLVFSFIWFMGKKLRKYSARTQEKMADVNAVLEETVTNIRIVKGYAMENFEKKKFFKSTGEYFKSLVRMARVRNLASPVNDTLIIATGMLILLYAGTKILEGGGEMDAGDFMTFIIATFALIKPTKSLLSIHIRIQEGMAASERIFNILDAPVTVIEPSNARVKKNFKESIVYGNVSFAYTPGEPVLKDVSFEVKRGEVVALVGPSGAGKSTLFDLLPRFYDPVKGRIMIDGEDLRELSLASLRGMLGIVTQETYLFNDTIRNNIAYGMNGLPQAELEKASVAARAHDFIAEFEDGYETLVGNRGVRLSGGQRQRIAIARALLKNPQILIFDEATSALDTESERLVQEAIDGLMANRTVLVIAHRLSTIKNADHILVMDKGKILETGTHQELMQNEGLYHRLYMMQFKDQEGI